MTDEQRRIPAGSTILAYSLAALSLYVLSVGPLGWMDSHQLLPEGTPAYDALCMLYFPIAWVCEHCQPVDAVVGAYIELWD